mmetsp:Transcript_40138/g.52593  ORF Transcript_40138/g.52593 Transcript_40138/m.52593 type:complete len:212 (-) Transcript_40138:114-749(-)
MDDVMLAAGTASIAVENEINLVGDPGAGVDQDYDMEEHETTGEHIFHIIKTSFIVAKISLVTLFLTCAAIKYHRRYKSCNYQTVILSIYVLMLLTLLAMDLSMKIIPVFFVLVLGANYFNFIGFWLMVRNLPKIKGRSLRRRTMCYFVNMNILYLAIVIMAFFEPFHPKCTQEKAYPIVMSWASFLFVINYFFHCIVNYNMEFFIKPIEEE